MTQPYMVGCCCDEPPPGCFVVANICQPTAGAPNQVAMVCDVALAAGGGASFVFSVATPVFACYTMTLPQVPILEPGGLTVVLPSQVFPNCGSCLPITACPTPVQQATCTSSFVVVVAGLAGCLAGTSVTFPSGGTIPISFNGFGWGGTITGSDVIGGCTNPASRQMSAELTCTSFFDSIPSWKIRISRSCGGAPNISCYYSRPLAFCPPLGAYNHLGYSSSQSTGATQCGTAITCNNSCCGGSVTLA